MSDVSRRRVAFGSLVVCAALSGLVVAEAERNYASVTKAPSPTATIVGVDIANRDLQVGLRVENTLNRPLRVEFAHIEVDDGTDAVTVSVPYRGIASLDPGESILEPTLSARRITDLSLDRSLTVSGYVAVTVYRQYRIDVPIDTREVTP